MFNKIDKIKNIIEKSSDPKLIEGAFRFAEAYYKERERISKENYFDHAIKVATTLNEMGFDSKVIAAGLLHDVIDEIPTFTQKIELKEIEKKFGKEVMFMVERVSELNKIHYPLTINIKDKTKLDREKFENLQKTFLALAGDLRVVLIELVSRLDNLNYLKHFHPDKQKIYLLETLKIFAPIADKLGIWELKYKLEDLTFFYLFPEKFNWLHLQIKEKYKERKNYLKSFVARLKKLLKRSGINVIKIDFRPKSYWSTYKKLLKYNNDIEKIHDLLALRVIVSTVENCYKALGIIHKYWKPFYEEIDDYIIKPKPNGYRSLHTTVFCEKGHITEIQIRTPEMDKEAEYGVCAHWAYKEKIDLIKDKEKLKLTKEIPEFWKTFKIDFYENKVFVFTPKGDVISLANGATPVDFAYAVHSEIGNHCESAKVNGKIVSLSGLLKNGDIVEIIVNKKRSPSPDWLKFIKTNLARAQIKKALAKSEGFKLSSLPQKIFSLPQLITRRVFGITEKRKRPKKAKKEEKEIYLAGQKGILVNIAKCCHPKSGDQVSAYLTKYRAAVLHKISCKNFQKLAKKFPEKVIDASWK